MRKVSDSLCGRHWVKLKEKKKLKDLVTSGGLLMPGHGELQGTLYRLQSLLTPVLSTFSRKPTLRTEQRANG